MDEYLQMTLVSARHHQLRNMALLSIRPESPRYRRSFGLAGITVSYETIRFLRFKFWVRYARRLSRHPLGFGDTFFIDEVFAKINGKLHYLRRAVDQDGEVVEGFLQAGRDGAAAKRLFKRLLRSHGGEPRKIVTDKLSGYGVAHRELITETIQIG